MEEGQAIHLLPFIDAKVIHNWKKSILWIFPKFFKTIALIINRYEGENQQCCQIFGRRSECPVLKISPTKKNNQSPEV